MTEFEDEKPGLSGFSKALIMLFIVALCLAGFYWFSKSNAQRFRLVLDGEELVVEKGMFFLFGMATYEPEDRRFKPAYEPIILPEGSPGPSEKTYREVAEVDAALLAYLLDITRGLVAKGGPEDFEASLTLLKRAELLTALDEEQKRQLKAMRADVYYAQGKIILQKVADELRTVLEHFREAKLSAGSTGKYKDLDHWIALLESKIRFLESGGATMAPVAPQTAPQGPTMIPTTPVPTAPATAPATGWPQAPPAAAPAPAPAPAPAARPPAARPPAPAPAEPAPAGGASTL